MSFIFRHNLMALLISFLLVGCSICEDGPQEPQEPTSQKVELGVRVAVTDGAAFLGMQSRGPLADAVSDDEKMQTLRIIIVRPDSTVEHNRYYDFHQAPTTYFTTEKFKVEGGEQKKIYLFANENTTFTTGHKVADYDFGAIKVGKPFPTDEVTGQDIETSLIEVNDALTQIATPLFMSEAHEVAMPKADHDVELIIVRAAVKFTFMLKNESSENLPLEELTISKLARREYLLPKNVVYGSEISPEDNKTQVQYIKSYDVPMVGNNEHYNFKLALADKYPQLNANSTLTLDPIYLLESNYDDQPGVEGRNYKISLTLNGETYENGFFDNLEALPRNTHVVVDVKLNTELKELNCSVRVYPYGEYWLNPGFGQ